jgi:glycosyltransferase involved in cell wall biosynthesis/tetratricopeptide (TPR) repeat protein
MAMQKKNGISASSFNVSLVIPCYNEEGRVDELLKGLEDFSLQAKFVFEIIIVDDGSNDETVNKIESSNLYKRLSTINQFIIIKQPRNSGKGNALKAGVEKASKDYILTIDADLSTVPQELNSFLSEASSNRILIGSREHKDSKITSTSSRKTVGRIFNAIVRCTTPLSIKDTQCGFKLYPSGVAKKIFQSLKTGGWAHDVELLYKAKLNGVEIIEMPIKWESMEGSKINVMKDSIKMFFEVLIISLRVRLNWFLISPFQNITFSNNNDSVFRGLFAISAIVLFFVMTSLSFQYGITGDDLDQKLYGEAVLKYYTSFGKDTSSLHLKVGNKENLYIYGGMFNMFSAAANKYIGGIDEYDMRHLFNSIAGFFAILFCGLLAKSIGNWFTGFLALLLLAFWPQFFGQSMNNPKDIPFALGYIMTIYYLFKLVIELPKPQLRTWIMIAFGIAFTINIRVGGLILVGMMGAFVIGAYILSSEKRNVINHSKSFTKIIRNMIIVSVCGFFGGLLFWPYALQAPLSNPFIALSEFTKFSFPIGLLFEGKMMTSLEVPWYYIPKWLLITTPLVIIFSALSFGVLWFFARKKYDSTLSLLLIFATLFPWAYAVYSKSALYDGMRQFLFIVPMIAVCAALAWHYLITFSNNKIITGLLAVLFTIGLILPIKFSIANHPNEYCYFNEIIGGVKGAYGKYDTDYYMNSIRKTSDWFKQSEMYMNANSQNKILLATNAVDPVNWYFRNDTDKVKIVYTKWNSPNNPKTRGARNWDYGIYFSRDIDPSMLSTGTWPSNKAIFKNEADGVPLSVVIERKNKSDFYASEAMKKDSMLLAEKLLQEALAYNPQNEEACMNMVQVKMNLKKYSEAIQFANQLIALYPNNDNSYIMMGVAYAYSNDFQNAVNSLSYATEKNPKNYQAFNILGQLYQQRGDMQTAQQYLSRAQEIQQSLQQQ